MNIRTHLCLTTIATLCGVAHAGPPMAIVSSFDADTEGWSTRKDARDFRWESTGGNPGGFIAADDIGSGSYWRFAASDAYLGDLSAYYGQTLSYQLKQLGTVGTVTNQDDVEITGDVITLTYRFNNAPEGEWTTFSVELAEGVGWMVSNSPATEAQIRTVLENVTELSIRGEYRAGSDSCGLDNVRLSAPCLVDFNNDGMLNFFDVSDFINAYTAGDPSADLAAPFGELNFFDVSAFVSAFAAGC